MANTSLFRSFRGKRLPKTDAINEAGGRAHAFGAEHALAQYAATGCLNTTFYASAETQLETVIGLCGRCDATFVAKAAVWARAQGHMKDLPALMLAYLTVASPGLFAEVFDRVVDNGKMLRNFVQIMRSRAVGRSSLGTLPKRMVQQWLESRSEEELFRASVGGDPSLADVIRMVHPRPATRARANFYAYLLGRPCDAEALPELVRRYEAFKAGAARAEGVEAPGVPMEMLTALPLRPEDWARIARGASWQATRMNLNTFARHGVYSDRETVEAIAEKLRDPERIARARVLPYQLMIAYQTIGAEAPEPIRGALQDAMETAIGNVPALGGKVWVFPDVSGSMRSPVTGARRGSTSAVRCVDVAALVAAAVLRKNPGAGVLPFSDGVVEARLNPRDSVMTNAALLASLPAGGTNCSAPLALLNARKETGDVVIYVSDNESWVDSAGPAHRSTATLREWAGFKARNPRARMVCLDVQPYGTTQAPDAPEGVMNIGGFSDAVFGVISEFASGRLGSDHWVGVINGVRI